MDEGAECGIVLVGCLFELLGSLLVGLLPDLPYLFPSERFSECGGEGSRGFDGPYAPSGRSGATSYSPPLQPWRTVGGFEQRIWRFGKVLGMVNVVLEARGRSTQTSVSCDLDEELLVLAF